MTAQAWLVAAVVLGGVILFVSEKVRYDVIALLILALLLIGGVLTPQEGLSGFSNEATLVVAAMFALNAGLVGTGALEPLIQAFTRIRRPWLLMLALLCCTALLGAFVKNTALVATFLPVTLSICARSRIAPSRLLLPMAYAAQMGGVCTLLGTSSNLLANSLAVQHGLPAFGVFEFTRLGAVLAVVGIAYLMLLSRWLLPRHTDLDYAESHSLGAYVTELRINAESPLLGQRVSDLKLGERYGVYVLELLREGQHLWAPREQTLLEGDVLLVRGEWERLETFQRDAGLALAPDHARSHDASDGPRRVIEALVAPGSRVAGYNIGEIDFPGSLGADVLAVQRRGNVLRDQLKNVRLVVGDVVLLLIDAAAIESLRRDTGLVALSERVARPRARRRAILAVAIVVAVVLMAGLGVLPLVVSALAGCVLMALTGCFNFENVYDAIDWKVIITLGAILPLGLAMDKTGLAQTLVDGGLLLVGDGGPWVALLMVYVLTALLTEMMGHNPSVVLMVPLAISVAKALQVDPHSFIVTVAFAAATSFATPVGYPTNTMVYNAGGYRFTDFMRIGIPLIALFCAISVWLIPRFWPFHP